MIIRLSQSEIYGIREHWRKPMLAIESSSFSKAGEIVRSMDNEQLINHFFLTQLKEAYFDLEGKNYHNKATDAGGPTKAGVTLGFARRYGVQTVEQLKNKSLDELWLMVYSTFFKKWKLWVADDKEIISMVFLLCLNAGYGVKQIQDAINRTKVPGVKVVTDNKMGPNTRSALYVIGKGDHKDRFLKLVNDEFKDYYNYLADKNPITGAPNRKGWINRVNKVTAFNKNVVSTLDSLFS